MGLFWNFDVLGRTVDHENLLRENKAALKLAQDKLQQYDNLIHAGYGELKAYEESLERYQNQLEIQSGALDYHEELIQNIEKEIKQALEKIRLEIQEHDIRITESEHRIYGKQDDILKAEVSSTAVLDKKLEDIMIDIMNYLQKYEEKRKKESNKLKTFSLFLITINLVVLVGIIVILLGNLNLLW